MSFPATPPSLPPPAHSPWGTPEGVPVEPPENAERRRPRPHSTADLRRDLAALALYVLSLGSTYWVSTFRPYILIEEWPVAVLASLAAVAVLLSAVLRRFDLAPSRLAHLIRVIPVGTFMVVALAYLVLMSLGLGVQSSAPGFGFGYLVALAFGIVALLPRTEDLAFRNGRIWTWFGVILASVSGVANLALPFFSSEWDAQDFNPGSLILQILIVSAVPLLGLWHPAAELWPALRAVGVILMAFTVVLGFTRDVEFFAGAYGAPLGPVFALVLAGLLAWGRPAQRQSRRMFALTATIIAGVASLLAAAHRVVQNPSFWELEGDPTLTGAVLALIPLGVFMFLRGSRRRVLALPPLAGATLVYLLTTVAVYQNLTSWSYLSDDMPLAAGSLPLVPAAMTALLVFALMRADGDENFDVLSTHFRVSSGHGSDTLATAEAAAHRQSAAVLAVLSLVTGPFGVFFGLSSLHRSRQAERSGQLATAIRMIAGSGITLGAVLLMWMILTFPVWTQR